MSKEVIDILDMDGCVIRNEETGIVLAVLREKNRKLVVKRTPACSLGDYFYILSYLMDLGFEVL